MKKQRLFSVLVMLGLLASTLTFGPNRSHAAENSRTFPETGKTVNGTFLDYWNDARRPRPARLPDLRRDAGAI